MIGGGGIPAQGVARLEHFLRPRHAPAGKAPRGTAQRQDRLHAIRTDGFEQPDRNTGEHRLAQRRHEIGALGRQKGAWLEPFPGVRQRRPAFRPAGAFALSFDR